MDAVTISTSTSYIDNINSSYGISNTYDEYNYKISELDNRIVINNAEINDLKSRLDWTHSNLANQLSSLEDKINQKSDYQEYMNDIIFKLDTMYEFAKNEIDEMEKRDNMKKVVVKFENSPKEYTYYTSLDLKPGESYTITNQNGYNYNNDVVIVIKYTDAILFGMTLNTIVKAEVVKKELARPDDGIKNVYFNPEKRTTVVLWKDGTKTIVKCSEDDEWDEEKAIALCYMKKYFNNRGCFNETLKKYCTQYWELDY